MWTQIGGQTRVECSALQFITRSPQSPVATIFISSRSTIRKFDALVQKPAYCHPIPSGACPGGAVLRDCETRLHCARQFEGRWTDRPSHECRNTHVYPLQTLPRVATVQGPDQNQWITGKLIRRLDAGQFFMAGVSFSSQI